jgi:hypothetical protein
VQLSSTWTTTGRARRGENGWHPFPLENKGIAGVGFAPLERRWYRIEATAPQLEFSPKYYSMTQSCKKNPRLVDDDVGLRANVGIVFTLTLS